MRISCNGCRVLRKGCSDDCTIRPCLQWIRNPQAQANATLFLAKFYGRAGLVNLIDAGPPHLRPAIFKSLLFEACGRIVNPIHGSLGLMCSGSWQLCQAAVEAVLKGKPITPISSDSESALRACDIRHVSKDNKSSGSGNGSDKLHKVKSRTRCKRSGPKPNPSKFPEGFLGELCESKSHESEVSQHPSNRSDNGEGDSVSVEMVEARPVKSDGSDVELDLTLCL